MKNWERRKLQMVSDVLDKLLGDTDPDTSGLKNDEIREEEPIFWCATIINGILGKSRRQND